MEDFKFAKILEFQDKEYLGKKCDTESLIKLTNEINNCFSNEQNNFYRLCYLLSELKDLFHSQKSYYHSFETAEKIYTFERYCIDVIGLSERVVYKCINCYKKFMFLESAGAGSFKIVCIKSKFVNFSKAKLFELLSVSDFQLDKDITSGVLYSDMSVREIREYVKSLKGKKKNNKVLEDNDSEEQTLEQVETTFDIKKEYTFDYFKERSKNQLIDIAFKCYMKAKELMNKTKTKKGGNN